VATLVLNKTGRVMGSGWVGGNPSAQNLSGTTCHPAVDAGHSLPLTGESNLTFASCWLKTFTGNTGTSVEFVDEA
jgi:hypothetical protein